MDENKQGLDPFLYAKIEWLEFAVNLDGGY